MFVWYHIEVQRWLPHLGDALVPCGNMLGAQVRRRAEHCFQLQDGFTREARGKDFVRPFLGIVVAFVVPHDFLGRQPARAASTKEQTPAIGDNPRQGV
ncbi:MAG: hypothetical protein N3B01_11195 [Verrucomicrobiae bacterium]|nr:hypothetical protein [Verrucomicrobiae bacterium]